MSEVSAFRDQADLDLVAEFGELIGHDGRIAASELQRLIERAVWTDGRGDKRTARALRAALRELLGGPVEPDARLVELVRRSA
jgi:hypothetical protein